MTDHPIKLRNSASASSKPEPFVPLDWKDPSIPDAEKKVRMYVCGPTVYDRAHIGNARPAVVFDVLYRLLRHVYGEDHVTYVRNITDIDDKINARGPEDFPDLPPLEGIARVTEKTTGWYLDDMKALGCLEPTKQPRATAYVPNMIEMIEALVDKGFAYAAEGHVLFEVARYEKYGALSGRSTDDMIAGARVEVAPYKRDPMDFVLWKPSAADQPGWDSPWGRGRPGWHIECSAMAKALLGETFDIHAGGADLQFPHHENEVAQSCCANGTDFAKVWLHNGMVAVDGRKMSKSLGNFITMEDLRGQAPGEVLRLALLMTHYRGTLDWTEKTVSDARKTLEKWRGIVGMAGSVGDVHSEVVAALEDDLNFPRAIAQLHQLALAGDVNHLKGSANLIGLLQDQMGSWAERDDITDAHRSLIELLLKDRLDAKNRKDFERADELRDGLVKAGVVVMDRPGKPSEWSLGSNFDPAKLEEAG